MLAPLSLHRRLPLAWAAGALMLGACGGATPEPADAYEATPGGTKLEPASATETEALSRLDQLQSGQPTPMAGASVTAEPPYFSASGRTCRWLAISVDGSAGAVRKLACKEGRSPEPGEISPWFFVPDVFAPPAEGEPSAP